MCRYLTRIGQVLPASTVSHLNQESGFIHRMPIGYEALSSEQGWFISKENKEFNIVIHADDYIYIHFTNVLTQKACRKKMWDMTYKNMMPWVTWHCIFGMISLVLVNEKGKLQNRTVRTVLTSPRRHSADPRVEHNSKVDIAVCAHEVSQTFWGTFVLYWSFLNFLKGVHKTFPP